MPAIAQTVGRPRTQLAFEAVATESSTFLFADIAGFTALTEAHGDEHAVALVHDFAEAVKRELPPVNGEHVKTIGDALMVRVPDPGDAVRLGLAITHDLPGGHEAPAVRVGLNHGPALERNGDYFGNTINVAARVSALASGGEVLVTGHTAALAPDLEGVFYESRGRQPLRNIAEPLEIFAAYPVQKAADELGLARFGQSFGIARQFGDAPVVMGAAIVHD